MFTYARPNHTTTVKRKVIIDMDTGADDASALILAARNPNIEILGVTVLAGNVDLEQGTKNALMALEVAGVDAKVYKGSDTNCSNKKIEAFSVFGKDGMGDADLIHPKKQAEEKDAIEFILDTINEYPYEVELIALGPATNVAKAIQRDIDTMKKLKMIWSMGTAGLSVGNATPVAEFNVFNDPIAYDIMLQSGIPITIIGLDKCDEMSQWTNEQFELLKSINDIGRFVYASFGKLREFYAMNGSANSVMNCDALAMSCLIFDGFINKTVTCHGKCVTHDCEAYGQVIFYRQGFTYDVAKNDFDYNVELVTDVDEADYFYLFLRSITT
jgi:purine nucleosidase